jgi:REP element-mobilizing transposase RayT
MPRKPRVEFPGAFYHVIARGNRRAVIFHDDADYTTYLERLERYRARDRCTLYAYVLMANHVHLLVETSDVPLARMMQTLQFTYSQYYNRRYGTTGHVFQGRYKAILCDRDPYLLELVRYLHLNPARVRTPLSPWPYPWSSHRAYLGEGAAVQVNTTRVLEQFHHQLGPARQRYRRFLKEGLAQGHEEKFYDTVDQRFLGDDRFIRDVARRTASRGELASPPSRVPFGKLLSTIAHTHRTRPAVLLAPGRQRAAVPARAMLVFFAREWGRLTTQELGKRLHRDPSMVSRLYALYAEHRNPHAEAQLKRALTP